VEIWSAMLKRERLEEGTGKKATYRDAGLSTRSLLRLGLELCSLGASTLLLGRHLLRHYLFRLESFW
jgi:hypothetical protein